MKYNSITKENAKQSHPRPTRTPAKADEPSSLKFQHFLKTSNQYLLF